VSTGTNQTFGQVYNQRIVLDVIRLHGPISRADLARRTNLAFQTVSNLVKDLAERRLVLEKGQRKGGRGQPPTLLELNPEGAFAVGFELDRDHLTGVLVNLAGTVLARAHRELDYPTPDEALGLMGEMTEGFLREHEPPRSRLWGVGVGVPGPLHIAEGSVESTVNPSIVNPLDFPGWTEVPVSERLGALTGLPVYLENDATAAAIGERWYGVGQESGHFFYVYLGRGLGGGLVLAERPYHGFGGNAGELGSIYVPSEGGRTRLADAFSLRSLYERLAREGVRVSRPSELAPLYAAGHPVLSAWLERAAQQLAPALNAVEALLDPEVIVFGGKWPAAMTDGLLRHLKELLPAFAQPKPYAPALRRAQVGEDAGALGVATLPIHWTLAPRPELLLKRGGEVWAETAPLAGRG